MENSAVFHQVHIFRTAIMISVSAVFNGLIHVLYKVFCKGTQHVLLVHS
jgi:hypothetical protein